MKLTIHQQLGDTVQDKIFEGSVDDCLKVIDHLEQTSDDKQEFDKVGKAVENKIKEFSENYLQRLKDEHLIDMDEETQQVVWLRNTNEHVLTRVPLKLDIDYSAETLSDFQRALQEAVDEGRLYL